MSTRTPEQHVLVLDEMRQHELRAADYHFGRGELGAGTSRMDNANALAWALDLIAAAAMILGARS